MSLLSRKTFYNYKPISYTYQKFNCHSNIMLIRKIINTKRKLIEQFKSKCKISWHEISIIHVISWNLGSVKKFQEGSYQVRNKRFYPNDLKNFVNCRALQCLFLYFLTSKWNVSRFTELVLINKSSTITDSVL